MEHLFGFLLAALIIEKLVEQIKTKVPAVTQWVTSLVALALSVLMVWGVPQLRFLTLIYGEAGEIADVVFSAAALTAGSGFISSLENFFDSPQKLLVAETSPAGLTKEPEVSEE